MLMPAYQIVPYVCLCACVSLDAHTRTRSRSCTVRTAAGATLTHKAPHLRWARWWRVTAWPTTAALTAGWLWASRGVRSSAAQGPTWSGPTPWTAPPLTLQHRPPGPLQLRYNKTQWSNPYHLLSLTVKGGWTLNSYVLFELRTKLVTIMKWWKLIFNFNIMLYLQNWLKRDFLFSFFSPPHGCA